MEYLFETLGGYFKPEPCQLEKEHLYRKYYNMEICKCKNDKTYLSNSALTICLDCNKLKSEYHPIK